MGAPEKKLTIVVGRDARPSGPMVQSLVTATLQAMGVNVIDLGMATTPTVEMAVPHHNADGGIIFSASHNPVQWNALKLLDASGEFLSAEAGKRILELAADDKAEYVPVKELGKITEDKKALERHIKAILALPLVDKEAISKADFSVAVDAVNSIGGVAIPALLESLGVVRVTKLNCEPDGQFAHNPEPLPEHLQEIHQLMEKGDNDLGVVVDPDADRLAFITETGRYFGEEYTLVAVADYVLQNTPSPTVSNLSSTRALRDITEKHGQAYHTAAVGEVNVVGQMKAVGAKIGGEGNGGVIYPELHPGRDALVGVALMLTYMAKSGKSAGQLRASYPEYVISKNKIELDASVNLDGVLDGLAKKYARETINRIDGLKIEFERDWVHLRRSNTEPIIRIYAESDSPTKAETLARKLMADVQEVLTVEA